VRLSSGAAPPPVDPAELEDISILVRRMPDRHRTFHVSGRQAEAEFAIGASLQESLRRAGFPCAHDADGLVFDPFDLLNASMSLDLGSRQRRVLAWWVRELGRPAGDVVDYQLDYVPDCPSPAHGGPCRYRLYVPDGSWLDRTGDPGRSQVVCSVRFTLPRRWPQLPEELVALLEPFRQIRFLRLPESLRWDTEFIRASGVADCAGSATLLVAQGSARGLRARFSYGRSLTPPFSAPHCWAEFLVAGTWVPVDPVLIEAFRTWRLVSGPEWDGHPSLGSILGRIGGSREALVTHDGQSVAATFPAYRLG
jgi:hypothetical protein